MRYSNVHSPVWGNRNHTTINLLVTFDCLREEVGFTAAPYDIELYGCQLYELAFSGEFGEIADYVEPEKTFAQLAQIEDDWRISELDMIADQLLALEDDDPTAMFVTERQWRDYRILVRAWKGRSAHFPDLAHRPVRPDPSDVRMLT